MTGRCTPTRALEPRPAFAPCSSACSSARSCRSPAEAIPPRRRREPAGGGLGLGRATLLSLACAAALLAPAGVARAAADPPPTAGAPASFGAPPWSAEAPGAAGAPLGLGLDAFTERQRSLTIDSARTTVTTDDLARGTTLTQVLEGDPALLNRKFSIRWKASGFGAQVPFALPRVPLGKGLGITPTLVFQAARSDVEIDFLDLPEPQASTSLRGSGLLLGAAFDLAGPLCRRCGWYGGAGYRYRFFPRFGVDRGQPVQEPGARVAASDVRLGRTISEASLRVGRVFGRGRAALYLGVLRRQARTTVDDDLTLVQEDIGQRTRLASRTRFASTLTATLAGLDVHVGGPVFLRAEVSFAKGDRNVLGKLMVVPPLRPWFPELRPRHAEESEPAPGHPKDAEQQPGRLKDSERQPRRSKGSERQPRGPEDPEWLRASQIAAAIAPGLAAIRERFIKESHRLLAQQPAPSAAEVSRLLDDTRCDLFSTLNAPELAGLRDFVQDLFVKAREGLGLGPAGPCTRAGADASPAPLAAASPGEAPAARGLRILPAVLSSRWLAHQVGAAPARQATVDRPAAKSWFDRIADVLSTVLRQSTEDDIRVHLCVRSDPPQARFALHYHVGDSTGRVPGAKINTNHDLRAYRGLYRYTVDLENYKPIALDDFDLVMDSSPILNCTLIKVGAGMVARVCARDPGVIEEECRK